MNFRLNDDHSVILMSVRPNAPYADRIEDDGATLIYEGHDEPRRADGSDPKAVDQPMTTGLGALTENGKFHHAAQLFCKQGRGPERVRVYEKLRPGIWSYNGLFDLVDSWLEHDGRRQVFKFKLIPTLSPVQSTDWPQTDLGHNRIIPTTVKVEVWKRDKGRCVICGAADNLHFDHIIPFSRGGTSLKAENIQLLCARHNLAKRDDIA
jgi:hypothetical protein